MFDISKEEPITLSEAAKLLPPRRNGKRPHFTTLYRWASQGLHGVKLEVVKIGGTACTSRPALQRFFNCLTTRDLRITEPMPDIQAMTDAAVETELDEMGI